ncbi:hypothetical protein ACFW9X_34960, partial [Streptomyces sp. NPDC059466]|uniref:hypothetical protein n=1 Tax=Streptomyces sp. NPDC059466 TaxID=3346843 RepID=UPI0036C885F1
MQSTRKTVVSLVAVGTLLGAAGVAAADTASPAPSGAPTGDGAAALCRRAPKTDQRIDRILDRLHGDASRRGSVAPREHRGAHTPAAGHTESET